MKKYATLLSLIAMISTGAYAMELNKVKAEGENALSVITKKETKDMGIQASSYFLEAPLGWSTVKRLVAPETAQVLGVYAGSVIAGMSTGIVVQVIADKLGIKGNMAGATVLGTLLASELLVMKKGFDIIDRDTVPGGVPAGAVLVSKKVDSEDENGQPIRKTIQFYTLPENEDVSTYY